MVSPRNKNFLMHYMRPDMQHAGFTLIEVLVAIAVITIIGFLPISIVSDHIIKNALTKNRVTAGLLAQEITEYVRYTRDSDILDPNGGDWFDTLFDPQVANEYNNCVVHADDWILDNYANYCTIECYNGADKTVQGECGTTGTGNKVYNGLVAGIATATNVRGKNADTCDGNTPKTDNQFTTTMNLVISQPDAEVRYAVAVPCISWSDKTNTIKRVTVKEGIFEWIRKK